MSGLIKGMTMPKNCEVCPRFCHLDTRNCPLVELSEKHGRLIDENDVIDAIHDRLRELQTHKEFAKKHGDIDLLGVLPYISKIQAVIEAEGEE